MSKSPKPKGNKAMTKKPSAVVTSEIHNTAFTPEDEAAMIGAAAAVAESDAGEADAVETYGRKLGVAPTLAMYTHAQSLFQSGYMQAQPAVSPDALAKRTSRFFSDVLKAYGIKRPESHDPAAEKKREQREAAKVALLAKFKGVEPKAIKEQIAQGYAKLAASVPDAPEVKKAVKEAETALRLMTADQEEAFKKQKAALVSSLMEAVKKCTDLKKIGDALKALK
jgi:hypothetical protein